MLTFKEFQKFVTDKLNGVIPQNADDGGVSYEVVNSYNNDGGEKIEKLVNLAIGPKSEAQVKVRNDLVYTSPGFLKAIENFELYVAQQQKQQEIKVFMDMPEASNAKASADELIQKLKDKITENTGSVLGSLWSSHKKKLDNKSETIKNIIKEVEELGYKDPETYKKRFSDVLSKYIEKNADPNALPILGSDTKAKLEGVVNKLNPAPAASKKKPGSGT